MKLVSWIFRLGGINPVNNWSDKYFATATVFLVLMNLRVAAIEFWRQEGGPIPSILLTLSSIVHHYNMIVFVVRANISKSRFTTILKFSLVGDEEGIFRVFEGFVLIVYLATLFLRLWFYRMSCSTLFSCVVGSIIISLPYLVIMQHVFIVMRVKGQFNSLNEELRKFDGHSNRGVVNLIFLKHAKLRKFVLSLNSVYGLFYLHHVTAYLLMGTTVAYEWVLMILNGESLFKGYTFIPSYLIGSTAVVGSCVACHACGKKAHETILLAHRLLDSSSSEELIDDVSDFSLSHFNNPVRFSACGVFNVDHGLITKVTVMMLSYVMIALQLNDVIVPDDLPAGVNTTTIATILADQPGPNSLF